MKNLNSASVATAKRYLGAIFKIVLAFALILHIQLSKSFGTETESDIEQAKELILRFEFKEARESLQEIRRKIIQKCRDKESVKTYLMTYVLEGISLYLEGNQIEAEKKLKSVLPVSRELEQLIRADQKLPKKIKDFIGNIKSDEKVYQVDILSGGDIFINGEFSCRTPCTVSLTQGINIVCTSELCIEKLITTEEKLFFRETEKHSKKIVTSVISVIVSSILVATITSAILMKNEKKQVLKIVIYE